ncbi:MAG: phosphoribosylaminoimidazolesuccinocarboxamide synthase, partial [Bacteroidales bacterium]
MSQAVVKTQFHFPKQKDLYIGKVRDVYNIDQKLLVMVVSDRISAFDVVLPKGIPYKGQVLNQIASYFLDATSDILPNWKLSTPDPMVTVGKFCDTFKVEMVVRAYLSGHAWREYKEGKRTLCGENLPNGLKENDALPKPIITPTTKAAIGHDEDISKAEILKLGLVSTQDYEQLEKYALALFARGTQMAKEK